MTARLFDNRLSREWAGFVFLRRLTIAALIVHFSLAAASGYRAIVQLYSVSIETGSTRMGPGERVLSRVVTSGRTWAAAKLELVQGENVVVIGAMEIPENDSFFYDPRPKRVSFVASLPTDLYARFERGAASLRLTATGRSQWLRVPPPKVQELPIELQ